MRNSDAPILQKCLKITIETRNNKLIKRILNICSCKNHLKIYPITMLIYYESKIKDLPLTHQIFEQFKNSEKIEIQHYKNLFDARI